MGDKSSRVNDAFQASKNIEKMLPELQNLLGLTKIAEKMLDELREGKQLEQENLAHMGLESTSSYVLRVKLRTIISSNKRREMELRSNIRTDIEILQKISACPNCRGSGEKLGHGYERFGRRIHKTISTEDCEHCGGTGKMDLGEELEKIVSKAINLVFDSNYLTI